MLRKYPLECFLVVVAVLGLLGVGLYMVMPAINAWWHEHWLLVTIVGIVAAAGGTSHRWVPLGWQIYIAITDHADVRRMREQHYQMLASVATKMEQGFDTNYKNAPLGFEISVHNPYMKNVKVQEILPNQIAAPIFPQPRDFAEILGSFAPNENGIYLLDTVNGPMTSPMNRLCHVALGGPTGGGKTGCTRLLTSQILACEGVVYMANPNFAPVKLNDRRLEDWRPIAARLKEPVSREIGEIIDLFERFIQLFEQRRAQEQQSPRRGKDIFLVVGEWPAIVTTVNLTQGKKAAERIVGQLGRLLRESRQYGIHVISEFQDALVSTIRGNSGVRENYRTAYYFGGDLNTAKVLLGLPNGAKFDDNGLGDKGASYLRSQSNDACPGRVPFFSNRALYMLLGTPEDPVNDDFVMNMEQVPTEFLPFVDSNPLAPSTQPLRRDESNFEKHFSTRNDEPHDDHVGALDDTDYLDSYAQKNVSDEPVDGTQETQEDVKYRLDTIQLEMFCVAYGLTGNIDESLKKAGAHTGYRVHARQIIAERNLKRGN